MIRSSPSDASEPGRPGPTRSTPPGLEVQSFYHLRQAPAAGDLCQGLACFVARHLDPVRAKASSGQQARMQCLGKCYAAPASAADSARPRIEVAAREPIVLRRVAAGGAATLAAYRQMDGYRALERALSRPPAWATGEIERSGLRGRGGAGFPAVRKWRAVSSAQSAHKYIVANGDEGDPGAYIDRFLMEEDPHAIIEAMIIAAWAVGADRGVVYVRAEYPAALGQMRSAVQDAQREGILGQQILGKTFAFDIDVVAGHGSYLCGEETALLNAIEGVRPDVRSRPPYPAERGLFGRPTLVHNVETLASVPWILARGGDAYAALGRGTSRGTKVVSLNSLFRRPGLYEVELGMPLGAIVDELGGGVGSGRLAAVLVGGPLAGLLPPALLDTPLAFDEMHAVGASVGHGGVIAVDEQTSIPELLGHVSAFAADESCGVCSPCRLGTRRIEQIVGAALAGHPEVGARNVWRALVPTLAETSLCGHGRGMADFASSIERYFGRELDQCLG